MVLKPQRPLLFYKALLTLSSLYRYVQSETETTEVKAMDHHFPTEPFIILRTQVLT